MLIFSPKDRPTAKQLLKHRVFDSISVSHIEQDAPYKLMLDIDRPNSYDYQNNKDLLFLKNSQYRREILKIANKYRHYQI